MNRRSLGFAGLMLPVLLGGAPEAPPSISSVATHPVWRALLHWTPGAARADLQDPSFFLAPTGALDPTAELQATLQALRGPEATVTAARFPARAAWLHRMGLLETAPAPATAFEAWWQGLNVQGVTLVFADAYLGAPASMFGHTLLVLRSPDRAEPLQQAVNYAAQTGEQSGLVFAVRGIFGLYQGRFSLVPYHQKLQEYANTEQRDLWEYPLVTTPEGLRLLGAHLWEIQGRGAPYYFFSGNCSYHLLHLVQVAHPEADLFSRLRPWVLPLDTVRAVAAAGLLGSARHRPSLAAQVRGLKDRLTEAEAGHARAIAQGQEAPRTLPGAAPRQAAMLDLATAWLQAERARGRLSQEDYQQRQFQLLSARAVLGAQPALGIDPPPPPDSGHPAQRVRIAVGQAQGALVTDFQWRPALHDPMDPPSGYVPGSEIAFVEPVLRWQPKDHQAWLERLTLVQVRVLRPRDPLLGGRSWRGGLVWDRESVDPTGRRLGAFRGQFGVGQTLGTDRRAVYALALGQGTGPRGPLGPSLGLGWEAGAWMAVGSRMRGALQAQRWAAVAGTAGTVWDFKAEARWSVGRQGAWGLDSHWQKTRGPWERVWRVYGNVFFR